MMKTGNLRMNTFMAGAIAMFVLIFMAVTTVKAIVNKAITLGDLLIVLILWVSVELAWSLLKAVAAWARGR